MADLKVTRFVIDGQNYVIPDAATGQKGLMSGSDFDKLAGITAGAEPNKIDSVKVNGTALNIASKAVDILIKESTENGKINVNDADIVIHGLAALAFLTKVSKSELEDTLKAEIEKATSDLTTLNGTGAGSIVKQIDDKITAWASAVTADNQTVDTFKELVDWVAQHGTEAIEIMGSINKINNILAGIGGDSEPATVAAYVAAEIKKLDLENTYVKKDGSKVLSTNDYTNEDKQKLTGIETGATKNTYKYDGDTQTLTLTGFSAAQE